MVRMSLSDALRRVADRNEALVAAYRDGAKQLLSGPLTSLASSMADQRKTLAKDIQVIAESPFKSSEIEIDLAPSGLEPHPARRGTGPKDILDLAFRAEASDYELLAALAGAVLPLSSDMAETLAAHADAARKRSAWAKDHLDLLDLKRG